MTLFEAFPTVLLDQDNRYFFDGLRNRELVLNRCRNCGTWHAEPLRPVCSACQSWDMGHEPVSGRGVVYMFTRLHQGPEIEGVSYDPPLTLAVVELAEQPALRVLGTIVGDQAQGDIIGRAVGLTWPDDLVAPRLAFALTQEA